MLTIGFVTGKKEPRFDWFFDSLALDCHISDLPFTLFEVIIVDYWLWYEGDARRAAVIAANRNRFLIKHQAPKDNPWQGPARKTDQDHWAVSNARNTALMLAESNRLLWLDDCSIVLPGCLQSHLEGNDMIAASWLKYRDMSVRAGVFVGGTLAGEKDPRLVLNRVQGEHAWSNNLSFPVSAALAIGNYDEAYDGARRGSDSDFGVRLERSGVALTYDRTVTQLLSTDDRSFLPSGKDQGENPGLWERVLRDQGRVLPVSSVSGVYSHRK